MVTKEQYLKGNPVKPGLHKLVSKEGQYKRIYTKSLNWWVQMGWSEESTSIKPVVSEAVQGKPKPQPKRRGRKPKASS